MLEIGGVILSLLLLLIFVILNLKSLTSLLIAMLGSPLIMAAIALVIIFKHFDNTQTNKEAIKFGYHVTIATISPPTFSCRHRRSLRMPRLVETMAMPSPCKGRGMSFTGR